MLLSTLTTADEIRAVLGVSATELPDRNLMLTQHDLLVTMSLEDINGAIPTAYTTVSAIPSGSRSSAQQRFYDLCRLYASYASAKLLLTSLPMFAVASLSDGKAGFTRAVDIYADTRAGVEGMFTAIRSRLATSYTGLYGGTVTASSSFSWVVLSTVTDPVTATTV